MSPEESGKESVGSPSSNLAIISLVTGILGLTLIPFVGSLVAIVTAAAARKEIRAGLSPVHNEGLATAGMILGIAGVTIPILGFCLLGTLVLFPACAGALFTLSTFESAIPTVPALVTAVLAV